MTSRAKRWAALWAAAVGILTLAVTGLALPQIDQRISPAAQTIPLKPPVSSSARALLEAATPKFWYAGAYATQVVSVPDHALDRYGENLAGYIGGRVSSARGYALEAETAGKLRAHYRNRGLASSFAIVVTSTVPRSASTAGFAAGAHDKVDVVVVDRRTRRVVGRYQCKAGGGAAWAALKSPDYADMTIVTTEEGREYVERQMRELPTSEQAAYRSRLATRIPDPDGSLLPTEARISQLGRSALVRNTLKQIGRVHSKGSRENVQKRFDVAGEASRQQRATIVEQTRAQYLEAQPPGRSRLDVDAELLGIARGEARAELARQQVNDISSRSSVGSDSWIDETSDFLRQADPETRLAIGDAAIDQLGRASGLGRSVRDRSLSAFWNAAPDELAEAVKEAAEGVPGSKVNLRWDLRISRKVNAWSRSPGNRVPAAFRDAIASLSTRVIFAAGKAGRAPQLAKRAVTRVPFKKALGPASVGFALYGAYDMFGRWERGEVDVSAFALKASAAAGEVAAFSYGAVALMLLAAPEPTGLTKVAGIAVGLVAVASAAADIHGDSVADAQSERRMTLYSKLEATDRFLVVTKEIESRYDRLLMELGAAGAPNQGR